MSFLKSTGTQETTTDLSADDQSLSMSLATLIPGILRSATPIHSIPVRESTNIVRLSLSWGYKMRHVWGLPRPYVDIT